MMDANTVVYIIGGVMAMVLGGGGGIGIRQVMLKKQNGKSETSILRRIVETQSETTKLLWKIDHKVDKETHELVSAMKRQREHEDLYHEWEKERDEKLCRAIDKLEEHLERKD